MTACSLSHKYKHIILYSTYTYMLFKSSILYKEFIEYLIPRHSNPAIKGQKCSYLQFNILKMAPVGQNASIRNSTCFRGYLSQGRKVFWFAAQSNLYCSWHALCRIRLMEYLVHILRRVCLK